MPDGSRSLEGEASAVSAGENAGPEALPRSSWRSGVLCGLLVVVVVLACGLGEQMGFEDDWSIGRTAALFAQTGHFVYNGWEAPAEGWLILWAAPFIKAFGFSYLVLRLSLLPIVFATVLLFHRSLMRFGFAERNASFGALTLGLSHIFLPVASSFMTDIPSLMVTLLCLVLCQKAVAQKQDRHVIVWLAAAALTNLIGGTVRQTAFLGVLLMIPGVGWWQRRRRGVLPATAVMAATGCVGIFLFLLWYHAHPYTVPEAAVPDSLAASDLARLLGQHLVAAARFLLVAVSPVIACNLPAILRLPRAVFWGGCACLSAFVALLAAPAWRYGVVGEALSYYGLSVSAAFAVVLAGLAVLFLILRRAAAKQGDDRALAPPRSSAPSWSSIFWLLGPVSAGYFLLVLPGGPSFGIGARYLLGLAPIAIVCLLKTHQDRAGSGIPRVAAVVLFLVGFAAFAKTNGRHSEHRAIVKAADMLRADNIPRTAISAGPEYDSETQLDATGYIDNPQMKAPAGAYRASVPPSGLPADSWQLMYTPAVAPRYFIVESPRPDLAMSKYAPVEYRVFVPPFRRSIYIQQLPGR